jgi:putative ABC transport system permease protein
MTINSFAEYSFRSSLKVYNDYNFNVGVMAEEGVLKKISSFKYIDKYSINKNAYMTLYLDEKDINKTILPEMKENDYDQARGKYSVYVKLSTLGNNEFKRYSKEIGVDENDYKDINNPKAIIIDESNYYSFSLGKYFQLALTDIKEKDKITLNSQDENNITKDITISKITSVYPIGFNNADSTSKTIQAFVTDEVYDSLDSAIKTDNSTTMYIKSSNPKKLVDKIDNYAKENQIEIDAQNVDEMVQLLKKVVLAISIFLYGFITLVSLITITNVINTITTSIYLRRREFAMLKAIGMTNSAFNKMIRFESVFYGLKSLLFGLPIGILIDHFMYKNVTSMFVYDYVLPYKAISISVIFVFVIIFITMIYSVRKIRNDNIIDVIKQENL